MNIEKHQTTTHTEVPAEQPTQTEIKGKAVEVVRADMTYQEAHAALDAFFLSEQSSHWVPHTTTIWNDRLVYFAKKQTIGADIGQVHDAISDAYVACFHKIRNLPTEKETQLVDEKHIEKLEPIITSTYIFRIIYNKMMDDARKVYKDQGRLATGEYSDLLPSSGQPSAESEALYNVSIAETQDHIDEVSLAILMWQIYDFSLDEIRSHLSNLAETDPRFKEYENYSYKAVESRRNRVPRKIKKLVKEGIISSPF